MYNRYISEDTPYVPIQEAEHPQGGGRSNSGTKGHGPASTGGFRFSSLFSGKEGLGALLGGKEGAGSLFSSAASDVYKRQGDSPGAGPAHGTWRSGR